MKAILSDYNSIYYPIRIDWNNGKKSIVIEGKYEALQYIKEFLPKDTIIVDKTK